MVETWKKEIGRDTFFRKDVNGRSEGKRTHGQDEDCE
jgi:hypothetical protein